MTICKWCGAPTEGSAPVSTCAGRYACSQRKAMEEGQDDRDATIAALKAEVERLTSKHAAWSANKERRHGEEKQLLRDDLARHQRALAAGPAALRREAECSDEEACGWASDDPPDDWRSTAAHRRAAILTVGAEVVEAAQRRAMEGRPAPRDGGGQAMTDDGIKVVLPYCYRTDDGRTFMRSGQTLDDLAYRMRCGHVFGEKNTTITTSDATLCAEYLCALRDIFAMTRAQREEWVRHNRAAQRRAMEEE